MTDTTINAILSFSVSFGLLGLFIALEALIPARRQRFSLERFTRHAGLAALGAISARLALGGGLVGIALLAQEHEIGLFNLLDAPTWLATILSVVLLDFAIWAQHLAMHHVPLLWRLHRLHHGDTRMDVSTALRFHPLEIVASLGFKVMLILMLGAPVLAVVAFGLILSAGALFTHANIQLPKRLEPMLRVLLVTPALHLIHHSSNIADTNSNFGFSTIIWDRIFGTYRSHSVSDNPLIGLEYGRGENDQSFQQMLANPWKTQS